MSEHSVRLGQRIRALRYHWSLSQEKPDALAGVSYTFLGEVERGAKFISFDIPAEVASALAVDLAEFVSYRAPQMDRRGCAATTAKRSSWQPGSGSTHWTMTGSRAVRPHTELRRWQALYRPAASSRCPSAHDGP